MKALTFLLFLAIIMYCDTTIIHLNSKNYLKSVQQSQFTLVYFYSASCNFCKQFTPVFQKLDKSNKLASFNVAFAKIDGPAYQNLTHSLQIFSYPNLILYRKGTELPIIFRKQRTQSNIIQFVKKINQTSQQPKYKAYILNTTNAQRVNQKLAIFYGVQYSPQYWQWDTLVKRDGHITWVFEPSQTTYVKAGNIQILSSQFGQSNELIQIQQKLAKTYAKLHSVSQQSWLKMAQRKKFTIIYFNKFGNKKNKQLLTDLASKIYDVNFIQIDGQHEEFKSALKFVGLPDEQYLVSVDKKYDAIYVADPPYTQQSLMKFISQAKNHKLTLYRKTQKSDKLNKLTRDNYNTKMNTNQDVLLFLYEKSAKSSKDMMKLFQYLVAKLKHNQNLLLLRCDVSMNQIEQFLGFVVQPVPRIVFFRNRMKDYPIHFDKRTVSAQSVIDFIMQNTTFDFDQSWAQL